MRYPGRTKMSEMVQVGEQEKSFESDDHDRDIKAAQIEVSFPPSPVTVLPRQLG
jgi:hypothetical protein